MWNVKLVSKIHASQVEFIVGGIYRHPNGNVKHFVNDLETALDKIPEEITVILAADINIDIIKYVNMIMQKLYSTYFIV